MKVHHEEKKMDVDDAIVEVLRHAPHCPLALNTRFVHLKNF